MLEYKKNLSLIPILALKGLLDPIWETKEEIDPLSILLGHLKDLLDLLLALLLLREMEEVEDILTSPTTIILIQTMEEEHPHLGVLTKEEHHPLDHLDLWEDLQSFLETGSKDPLAHLDH